MRAITSIIAFGALAALFCFFAGGCGSHSGSSSPYGNLPVDKPGPASAFAQSIPTLTPAQRDAVLAKKFGRKVAQPMPGSNP